MSAPISANSPAKTARQTIKSGATGPLLLLILFGIVDVSRSNAQIASWVNPDGGFYETVGNWAPVGVPDEANTIIFSQPSVYSVSLFGDQTVAELQGSNGTDVTFGIAGPSSPRTMNVNGNTMFDSASLTLSGNGFDPFIMNIGGDWQTSLGFDLGKYLQTSFNSDAAIGLDARTICFIK